MTTSTSPAAWAVEQLFGHRGPGGGLRRGRVGGHRLDQRPALGRTVGVEVVQDDEPGAGAGGTREDASLQRRELLAPAVVVHRVETEVDDVRSRADPDGEGGVGGVPTDHDGTWEGAAAVAVDGDDVVAGGDELLDEGVADLAGTEDDVAHQELFSVRKRVWSRTGRTAVSRVTVRAPAGAEDGELLLDLDADRRGHRPADRPGRGKVGRPEECDRPGAAQEHEGLRGTDAEARDRALDHQVARARSGSRRPRRRPRGRWPARRPSRAPR